MTHNALIKFLCTLLFFSNLHIMLAQKNISDSLKVELKQLHNKPQSNSVDTLKITLLFQLVESIYEDNVWPQYNDSALTLATQLCNSSNPQIKKFAIKSMVDGYTNQGYLYKIRGNINNAIEKYILAIKQSQKINYLLGEASSSINLAALLAQQKQLEEAVKYCQRALKISYIIKDKSIEAISVQSLASHFMLRLQYDSAEVYLIKSIELCKELNDKNRLGEAYNSLGVLYYRTKREKIALEQHYKALELFRISQNQVQLANTYFDISSLIYKFHQTNNDFVRSLSYLDSAIYYSQKSNYIESFSDIYRLKSDILVKWSEQPGISLSDKLKFTQQSLASFKLHKTYSDSIFNREVLNNTVKQQLNFEFDKKEAQQKIEQEKREVIVNANKKRQQLFIWFLSFIVLAVTIISLLIFRTLRLTRNQKLIIEKQKDMVVEKQKEILDSIRYAKRIQDAILTPQTYIERNLKRLKNKL